MKCFQLPAVGFVVSAIAMGATLSGCAAIAPSDVDHCVPSDRIQVTTEGEGSGPVVTENGIASLSLHLTDAQGQDQIPEQPISPDEDGNPTPVNLSYVTGSGYAGIAEMLRCGRAGETLTATLPASILFSPEALATVSDPNAVYTATVTVHDVLHSAATGVIEAQQSGIPAVVTAADGTPGVTMPKEVAPTQARTATTIRGFGTPVTDGQLVTLRISAFSWTTASQLFTNWDASATAPLQVVTGANSTLPSVTGSLIGVPVGSQQVVVLPASTIAASPNEFGSAFNNGDAVVFVVDVLDARDPQ